jgi:predicted RNA-binding protein associated with RNAse of E/G family
MSEIQSAGQDAAPAGTRPVVVHKLDARGRPLWRYTGRLVHDSPQLRVLQAVFDRQTTEVAGLRMDPGDQFTETFYSGRWYNVFAVHAAGDYGLRGWYCNITRPAVFTPADIYAEDLELDMVAFPDGRQVLADQPAFEALNLPQTERKQIARALVELRALHRRRAGPFSAEA